MTKASQSLCHGLATVAAILAERAQAPLSCWVLRFTFTSVVVRQHSAQSAIQTKPGLRERPPPWAAQTLAVPYENGECLVPGFVQVVGPFAVRNRFFINIPHIRRKRRWRTSKTHTDITIWTMNAAHRAGHVRRVEVHHEFNEFCWNWARWDSAVNDLKHTEMQTFALAVLPLSNVNSVVPLTLRLTASIVH